VESKLGFRTFDKSAISFAKFKPEGSPNVNMLLSFSIRTEVPYWKFSF